MLANLLPKLVFVALLCMGISVSAQFERTYVQLQCPCTLTTTDGLTAKVTFGIQNLSNRQYTDLHVTVGLSGTENGENQDFSNHTALLDTVLVTSLLAPNGVVDAKTYTIDMGVLPRGSFYFELMLHNGQNLKYDSVLDSIWFRGRIRTPAINLDLVDANYLIDTDQDGVGDLNEILESTDPFDPNELPPTPVVDVLIVHEDYGLEHINSTPAVYYGHIFAVTNYQYQVSGSPVHFRPVGLLGPDEFPADIEPVDPEGESYVTPAATRDLQEMFGFDTLAVYLDYLPSLCGWAENIGGMFSRGFIHPDENTEYTEMFRNPSNCSIDVTSHEIGHLMGLGHSFAQGAVGTFYWSRGHGVEGEFGTIMTYAETAYTGHGLNVFSHPHTDCAGKECGIDHSEPNTSGSADAVLSLNITKYQYARNATPDPDFDFDGDGVGIGQDAFPIDASETTDSDGDLYGDNRDAFPHDPLEWFDTDGDGVGDNTDPDIDDDGVLNAKDPHPREPRIQSLRTTSIHASTEYGEFGASAIQINDLNQDEYADLAISVPFFLSDDLSATGAVLLVSLQDVIEPVNQETDAEEEDAPTQRTIATLLQKPDTWVLEGSENFEQLGRQLVLFNHPDRDPELGIRSLAFLYLVPLANETLMTLDALDGAADQTVSLSSCLSTPYCSRIQIDANLEIFDIETIGDLDEDGAVDMGVIARNRDTELNLEIYLLTRDSIEKASSEMEASPTISSLLNREPANFLLTSSDIMLDRKGIGLDGADLEDLGHNEADATRLIAFSAASLDEIGRLYVLKTSQLSSLADFDQDGDRRIYIEDLTSNIAASLTTNSEYPFFGRRTEVLNDLDDDGRNDLLVWADDFFFFALTLQGVKARDFLDGRFDGIAHMSPEAETDHGTWLFNNFGRTFDSKRASVLRGESNLPNNTLVTRQNRSMIVSPLNDLDFLDDPNSEDLNGVVNIPLRLDHPGIYQLYAPYGPNGPMDYGDLVSLSDLDGDTYPEFAYFVYSVDLESPSTTMHVVFTSELATLDVSDGRSDHVIMLHNNFEDLDDDGLPNIYDRDDDGDGLDDLFDLYPTLSAFKYDADGDGYANAIDAFPLDYYEFRDTDFDGIGDIEDEDRDGDGILDEDDEYPSDTDNDGIPNSQDEDDDNDGVPDDEDEEPLNPDAS